MRKNKNKKNKKCISSNLYESLKEIINPCSSDVRRFVRFILNRGCYSYLWLGFLFHLNSIRRLTISTGLLGISVICFEELTSFRYAGARRLWSFWYWLRCKQQCCGHQRCVGIPNFGHGFRLFICAVLFYVAVVSYSTGHLILYWWIWDTVPILVHAPHLLLLGIKIWLKYQPESLTCI